MLKSINSSDVKNSSFSFDCNDLINVDDQVIAGEANGLAGGRPIRCPYTYLFKYFDAVSQEKIQLFSDILSAEKVWDKFIPHVAWKPEYIDMVTRELPLISDLDRVALKICYKNWVIPATRSSDSSVVEQALFQDGIPFFHLIVLRKISHLSVELLLSLIFLLIVIVYIKMLLLFLMTHFFLP
jgi:hypothetical protein